MYTSSELKAGMLALLDFDVTDYEIWNRSESKPANVFVQRTFDKFDIGLEAVLKRITFGFNGWSTILNNAWDYSLDVDVLSAAATAGNAYTATSLLSNDEKAILLAYYNFMNDARLPATVRKDDSTGYPALNLIG